MKELSPLEFFKYSLASLIVYRDINHHYFKPVLIAALERSAHYIDVQFQVCIDNVAAVTLLALQGSFPNGLAVVVCPIFAQLHVSFRWV